MNEDVACLGCGYDLRGMDDEATCPECGHGVGASRHAANRQMSRSDFAAVGVRLLAIWLVASNLYILAWAAALPWMFGRYGGSLDPLNLVVQFVPALLIVAIAAYLWFGAQRVARWIVGRDGPAFVGPAAYPSVWLRVGCTLLGLYFVVLGAAGLVSAALAGADDPTIGGPDAVTHAVQLAAGVLLAVGAARLRTWVTRARTFGVQRQ